MKTGKPGGASRPTLRPTYAAKRGRMKVGLEEKHQDDSEIDRTVTNIDYSIKISSETNVGWPDRPIERPYGYMSLLVKVGVKSLIGS
jgi:hypothetical protein